MAAIRGGNTKPERVIRSALHRAGFRFRLNRRDLPGKPDLVLPKYRATIFVHGCFWHGHDCPRFKQPGGENAEFWKAKINRNRERDREVAVGLSGKGWRQYVVWECALAGPARLTVEKIVSEVSQWLRSSAETGEISGIHAS